VIALAGITGACRKPAEESGESAAEPLAVTLEVARIQTLRNTITGQGTVVPAAAADWTIYPEETGHIIELPKAEGEAFNRGDVLVRFDYGSASADLAARRIQVTVAEAELEEAKRQFTKISAMNDRGYTARNDFEASKAGVASAELAVARAKAQLQAADSVADHAIVKARFPGVIAKRFHNEGDLVNASTRDPVLRVVDPSSAQVAMTVAVQDLPQLQPGQPATIVTPQGPEPGTVLLRPTPTDPRAAAQEVRLAFATPATTLPLDSPVGVEILLAERPNVIAVPAPALLRDESGHAFVMIAGVDGRAHRRDVRVGLSTRDRVEIVAGVTSGDRVIAKSPATVPEGTLITVDR
jgi:membrane fusion protein (multidrug efflux system)